MSVALLGAGRVASVHAAAFTRAGARVSYVVDPREEAARRLAAEVGAKPLEDAATALSDASLDALAIAAPHHLHAPLSEQALHAGKHVYSDKPLANEVAEGERLRELARERGLVLAVCHNLLFHPALLRAGKLISRGVLGRATTVDAWNCGWLDLAPWDFRRDAAATGGGAWFDGGGHLVYAIEALLGRFERLVATHGGGPSRIGGEDTCAASGRLEEGAAVSLRVSYSDRLPGHELGWPEGWRLGFDLRGTAGCLRLELLPRARLAWSEGGDQREEQLDVPFSAAFDDAAADFVEAVARGRPPRVGPSEALRVLELMRAAERE